MPQIKKNLMKKILILSLLFSNSLLGIYERFFIKLSPIFLPLAYYIKTDITIRKDIVQGYSNNLQTAEAWQGYRYGFISGLIPGINLLALMHTLYIKSQLTNKKIGIPLGLLAFQNGTIAGSSIYAAIPLALYLLKKCPK